LPLRTLKVPEISPGGRPVIDRSSVAYYRAVDFPEFDITRDFLSETFDIIIQSRFSNIPVTRIGPPATVAKCSMTTAYS